MTEIEKELKRFIASGKATKKDYSGGFLTTYIDPLKIAKHFAQWQKEQMMKDALEARSIGIHPLEKTVSYEVKYPNEFPSKFKKVKVIIIKE